MYVYMCVYVCMCICVWDASMDAAEGGGCGSGCVGWNGDIENLHACSCWLKPRHTTYMITHRDVPYSLRACIGEGWRDRNL